MGVIYRFDADGPVSETDFFCRGGGTYSIGFRQLFGFLLPAHNTYMIPAHDPGPAPGPGPSPDPGRLLFPVPVPVPCFDPISKYTWTERRGNARPVAMIPDNLKKIIQRNTLIISMFIIRSKKYQKKFKINLELILN